MLIKKIGYYGTLFQLSVQRYKKYFTYASVGVQNIIIPIFPSIFTHMQQLIGFERVILGGIAEDKNGSGKLNIYKTIEMGQKLMEYGLHGLNGFFISPK